MSFRDCRSAAATGGLLPVSASPVHEAAMSRSATRPAIDEIRRASGSGAKRNAPM